MLDLIEGQTTKPRDAISEREDMPNRKERAITGLSSPLREPTPTFTKADVAEMLGCPPIQISRDCAALWGSEMARQPLTKKQAWTLYAVACYRAKRYELDGACFVRKPEILRFLETPKEVILGVIEAMGGSQNDFDLRVAKLLASRQLSRHQRGVSEPLEIEAEKV